MFQGRTKSKSKNAEVSKAESQRFLAKIVTSERFAQTERLRSFLTYIVEETLAGRGPVIRAKTIAMDVYGRDMTAGGQSENVVRVDARRLRRCLEDYYQTEGKNDPIRIWVDSGGYAPRIERRDSMSSVQVLGLPKMLWIGAAVAIVVAGIGAAVMWGGRSLPLRTGSDQQSVLERRALREKSPDALQAVNLAEQARALLFPLLAAESQKIATDMFKQAIALDPEYFGGYAGAAQSLATLSKLVPSDGQTDQILSEATAMVAIAMAKNPSDGWTQSAAAWVAFASDDFERAYELSSRSAALSPTDGYVLDFHGMIAVLTGHFEDAKTASNPNRTRDFNKRGFAHRNLYGVVNIHLTAYEEALLSFQKATDMGDPISVLSVMFQAIAHQSLGHGEKARALVAEMKTTWPGFQPDRALLNFYQNPEHAEQLLEKLRAAGWTADNP